MLALPASDVDPVAVVVPPLSEEVVAFESDAGRAELIMMCVLQLKHASHAAADVDI